MSSVRFVALGDSLTEGVGDPVGDGWRGWAALLAPALAATADAVEFTNLAVSGAQTRDVLERQTPAALERRPDLVSVVIGVNDTLRHTFDIQAVAAHLDAVYAAFTREGATVLTACLPDPGAMLGLPSALARPLARRQRAVNTIVHALSERYGAVHLHAADGAWITDRTLWSADRLHPGERGHRQLAVRFHALLTEAGRATGQPPSPEPEFPAPTRAASLLWLATAGTAWVARRCKDLLPQLLRLAADELHHRARGTSARLDLSAAAAVSAALAALGPGQDAEAQRRPADTKATPGVPSPAQRAAGADTALAATLTGAAGTARAATLTGVAGEVGPSAASAVGEVGPSVVHAVAEVGPSVVRVAGEVSPSAVSVVAEVGPSVVRVTGEVSPSMAHAAGEVSPSMVSVVGEVGPSMVRVAGEVRPSTVRAVGEAGAPGAGAVRAVSAVGAAHEARPAPGRAAAVADAGCEALAPGSACAAVGAQPGRTTVVTG